MNADLLFVTGTVFLAVMGLTLLVSWAVLGGSSPARRRLDTLVTPAGGTTTVSLTDDTDARLVRFTRYVPKSPREMNRLQRRLARAGWHGVGPAVVYSLAELLLPVVLAGTTIAIMGFTRGWPYALVLGVIGYALPGVLLARAIDQRKRAIQNGLPDALDLLIVCVEAGMALDQAILAASEELAISHPALAEELRMITTEMRAGKPRLDAFKNFAERTKVDDVRALVAMLVQTDRFGTSIAQALRTHAETSRTKRRQRAEERAGKLGVKLVFPLVFLLFPALFVVTLGPGIIKIVRVLLQDVLRRNVGLP